MFFPFAGRCSKAPSLLTLIVVLSIAPAHAQEPADELTLGQALQLTLSANADLAAAQDRVRSLRAAAAQAASWPNPTLGLRREDAGIVDVVNIAELTQKIEISGVRGARHRTAASDAESAEWASRQTRARVEADVRSRFAELIAAQRRVGFADEDASLADSLAQAVSHRVAAGKVSPIEETRARLITGTARIAREQAQRDLVSARASLRALWNGTSDPGRAVGSLQGASELPPWPDLESRIDKLAAVLQADADVKSKQAQLDLERARRIPDPSIDGAIKRYVDRDEESYNFGVTVPLPLFDRNGHAVEAAQAALDQASAARRGKLASLRAEILVAYQRASVASREAALLDSDLVPAAQSAFDGTRKGYELGKFGLLDLLDAQRAYQQVRQQQLRAQLDAVTSRAELDRLIDAGGDAATP